MPSITKKIEAEFGDVKVEFRTVDFVGTIPVFGITVPDCAYLAKFWNQISNVVSVFYHGELSEKQDFERWNTYVFYLCPGDVENSVRGKIENDKFASRKIVIATEKETSDLDNLIARYITGSDFLKNHSDPDMHANSGNKEHNIKELAAVEVKGADPEGWPELRRLIRGEFITDRFGKNQARLESLLEKVEGHIIDET